MSESRCLVVVWMACAVVWMGCGQETADDPHERFGRSPVDQPTAAEYRRTCERYGERLTVGERAVALKELYIAPLREQLPAWRALGFCADDASLQVEALYELAWLGDGACVAIATHGLRHDRHAVRAAAAQALAHHATPEAHAAKAALRAALQDADESDERQLVWALVVLEDPQIFTKAIELWGAGKLNTVRGLANRPVFDPERVAKLAPRDDLVALAEHPRPAIRRLAATLLAQRPFPSPEQRLLELVTDSDISVAAPAASGLARRQSARAKRAVVQQLQLADPDRRMRLLEAIRDGAGGPGLVLALDAVVSDPEERRWFELRQIFQLLADLADPRSADPLARWLERHQDHLSLHWQTEAALRLAEVGEVRGAEMLGKRMVVESADLYDRAKPWQADRRGHLSRGDGQRIAAARLLGDLAILRPDQAPQLAAAAGETVLQWLQARPLPHAQGLRFLAAVDYQPAREPIHSWAFPRATLPKAQARPPLPVAFEAVSSALGAVGWMRMPRSAALLSSQFERKGHSVDLRGAIRSGGSRAMRSLALRNIACGAAHGLAHWGRDAGPQAAQQLLEVADDPTWHQDARWAACHALAFVADEQIIAKQVEALGRLAAGDDFRTTCYAETLARRPRSSHAGALLEALGGELSAQARLSVGAAIGRSRGLGPDIDAAHEQVLLGMLTDHQRRDAAALALMLGGSLQSAVEAALVIHRLGRPEREAFRRAFEHAVAVVYELDIEQGGLHRWVANADAIAQVTVDGARLTWAAEALARQLRSLEPGAGPHTLSRPMLRHRLLSQARSGDQRAVDTLRSMGERGVLMALAAEGGMTGRLAGQALRRFGSGPQSE